MGAQRRLSRRHASSEAASLRPRTRSEREMNEPQRSDFACPGIDTVPHFPYPARLFSLSLFGSRAALELEGPRCHARTALAALGSLSRAARARTKRDRFRDVRGVGAVRGNGLRRSMSDTLRGLRSAPRTSVPVPDECGSTAGEEEGRAGGRDSGGAYLPESRAAAL